MSITSSSRAGLSSAVFAGYRILDWIAGAGAFRLARARRVLDGAAVLLKVPPAEQSAAAYAASFRREYELLQSLNVPAVPKPIAFIREGEHVAIVLEDVPGTSLEALLRDQGVDVRTSLPVAISLARSLDGLRAAHVVHKDIHPANLLFDGNSGAVFIIDLSAAADRGRGLPSLASGSDWGYVAPEQTGRMNRAVDHRSDFYALGVLLYRMLSGRLPFEASDPLEWVHCHITRMPRPLTESPDRRCLS